MSLTPSEIKAEREWFEAWMRKSYVGNADLARSTGEALAKGEYMSTFTLSHWLGWLAAIESERDRVRQRQEDAEALMRMQEPQRARMLEKWENGE